MLPRSQRHQQLGIKEGIKATAKHFKAPVRATLTSVRDGLKPRVVESVVEPVAVSGTSSWLAHVRETQAKTGVTMKDAMRVAKESYMK